MFNKTSPTIFAPIPKINARHCGFTLAEVLITLTIIGVIAAITIPTLMKNYEKRQIEVGLAKTYQELSNAIKRSEIDNGDFNDWPLGNSFGDTNYINQYIAPYIKLNPCNGTCFSGKNQYWKGQPDHKDQIYGAYYLWAKYKLNDGRSIALNVNGDHQRNYGFIGFVVDVNGNRGKSVLGEDVFCFSYYDYVYNNVRVKGLYPIGSDNGGMQNKSNINNATKNCQNGGYTCAYFLMQNNWKFPDDYPIKF